MPKRKHKLGVRRRKGRKPAIPPSGITKRNRPDVSSDSAVKITDQRGLLTSLTRRMPLTSLRFRVWHLISHLKRINKALVLFTTISILCAGTFLYFRQALPVTIKSRLTDLREIDLRYSDYQSQGYSPVCG